MWRPETQPPGAALAPSVLAFHLTASAPGPRGTHPGDAPPASSLRRCPPGLPMSSETLQFSLGTDLCCCVCYLISVETGPHGHNALRNDSMAAKTGMYEHQRLQTSMGHVGWHLSLFSGSVLLFPGGAHPSSNPMPGQAVHTRRPGCVKKRSIIHVQAKRAAEASEGMKGLPNAVCSHGILGFSLIAFATL